MNKKGSVLIIVIVLIAIVVIGWLVVSLISDSEDTVNQDQIVEGRDVDDTIVVVEDDSDVDSGANTDSDDTTQETTEGVVEQEPVSQVKEFSMIARQWEFDPETITVKKGDTVKLTIESVDVDHGISLPGFGISERLNAGETALIEFVADKAGEYTFRCNVSCGSGHSGMDGKLIVEE